MRIEDAQSQLNQFISKATSDGQTEAFIGERRTPYSAGELRGALDTVRKLYAQLDTQVDREVFLRTVFDRFSWEMNAHDARTTFTTFSGQVLPSDDPDKAFLDAASDFRTWFASHIQAERSVSGGPVVSPLAAGLSRPR